MFQPEHVHCAVAISFSMGPAQALQILKGGSAYGLKSKHSKFDRGLRKRGLNILDEQIIILQLKEKLRDYFKLSKESLSFVIKILSFGE